MTRTLAYTKLRVGGSFIRRGASTARSLLVPGTYKPSAATTGAIGTGLPKENVGKDTLVIKSPITYENLEIFGDIIVQCPDVVIRNCILRGGTHTPGGASGVVDCNNAAAANVIVEDCTIDPQVVTRNRDGIVGHGYTALRNNIRNTVDGLGAFRLSVQGTDTDVVAYGNWIHDLVYFYPDWKDGVSGATWHTDGTHNDCMQIQGGANIHVKGNYFQGTSFLGPGSLANPDKPRLLSETPTNINGSGIIIQRNGAIAPLANVVVENNWFNGGLAGANFKPGSYTFQNNKFGRNYYKYTATSMFPIRGDDSTTTFVTGLYDSNRWEDTGALMAGAINGGTRADGIRWNNILD